MFNNRNTNKIGSIALVMMMMVSAVGLGLGAASVAATDSDPTILVHEPTTIDNSTDSVYADVTGVADMNGSGPVAVNMTVEGLTEGTDPGNGTILSEQQLSVTAGNVSSFDYALSDTETTDYDSVYMTVDVVTDGEESLIASTDWGVLQEVSGGGTGGLSSVGGVPILAIVALAGGYLVFMRD